MSNKENVRFWSLEELCTKSRCAGFHRPTFRRPETFLEGSQRFAKFIAEMISISADKTLLALTFEFHPSLTWA